MPRLIIFLYGAVMAVQPVFAQEEVPEDVFNHASHELAFRVPPGFELVTQKRGYVNVAGQKTPRFQRIWQHGSDIIIVNIGVWPEAVWHLPTDKERFDLVLTGMQLGESTTKVVSRRGYQLDGCPAESMTSNFAEPGGTSQRVDCFLSRPNVFMVGYASSKPSSWDDPASKAFFQSIFSEGEELSPERPNKAIKLTATRRTTSFPMTFTVSPAATRALVRHRSSCSR